MNKKATIKDIARELGLSANTISRALRDMPDISDETKALVRETAEKMAYHINIAASSLRTRNSKAIGVIVADIQNPLFSGAVKGVEFSCKASGYSMLLSNTNESYQEEVNALESMICRNVDGIILFPTMREDGTIHQLIERKIPFVLAGRKFSDIPTNVVVNDDMYGGYLAAEHLRVRGHSKFVYLAGPRHISSSLERYEGFRQYLRENGLAENSISLYETDATWQGGYQAVQELIEKGLDATAIFAFSDFIALGVLKALRDHGLRVPQDIAVIGHDDIDFCELTVPTLTTIDMSKFRLGKRAMETLLQEINSGSKKGGQYQQIIMEPHLIVREST